MGDTTKIETAGCTWNPWIGCNPVSEGCARCYAREMNGRWKWTQDFSVVTRAKRTWGNPPRWQREAEAVGRVGMVFCPSLSDFFHPPLRQSDFDRPCGCRERERFPDRGIWRILR